jgi:Bacterial pre-peptidase C-terminal domain
MNRLFARQIAAALVVAGAVAGGGLPRALAQPSLSHVAPGALAPGKTTELTLHGGKLDGALRVWTSFPAHVEIEAGDPKQKDRKAANCKITLAAEAPLGIGGIAVANTDGASDVVYLMIDDLPSVADSGNNHSATQPQEIGLPAAIDGQCDGTLSDFYRFTAAAGQRITCEVVATRLGWDFDSLIRILDASGNELLLADDDPSTGADARFVFTAPASGPYLLELRDNRYKPGGRYRLRLGDFPLVTTPLPLAAQRNMPTGIHFRGPLVETTRATTILPAGDFGIETALGLSIKEPSHSSAGWSTLRATELPVFVESRNGSAPKDATLLKLPCIASGVLESPGERDLFPFEARKGAALRFRAITRSAGSPAIVSLRVLDAAGKQLAESPVTDSDEPALSFAPTADGTYKLAVEELAGRGGGEFTYAVECTVGPQFSLVLKNDKNNRLRYSLASSGAFTLDVQCQRAGYDGPITLGIDSPRSGWQAFNNVIAAKANEGKMYVVPPFDLSEGEVAQFRVIGRAESSGQPIFAVMTTTVQLRAARPQMPYPPAWHDGAIFVSGLGARPGFFAVAGRETAIKLPRSEGQTQLTLDFERTDAKFKDAPLTVLPMGLPAGVTASVKRNGNGPKETYDIVLKGGKDLPEGEHTFRYFAYAENAGQGRGVMSGDIRLQIVSADPPAAEAKTP